MKLFLKGWLQKSIKLGNHKLLTVVGCEFDRAVNLLPSLFSVLLTEYVLKSLQHLRKKGEK